MTSAKKLSSGKNLKHLFSLLFFILCASLVHSTEYKPYIHNPNVPDHPDLDLQGSYKTELFPGAATYTFEIEIPEGTNGLKPQFAVFYNSHLTFQRPGIMGTAWSFNQNYILRDVEYTYSSTGDDTFKLVLNGKSHDLVYSTTDSRYHTKVESYFKIEKKTGAPNSNGEYWEVRDTDGTLYRFGYNSNAELVSNLYSYTVKWSLDQVSDMHQNNISYSYLENPFPNDLGAVYPEKIEYNNDKTRKVEFSYESTDRPDLWKVYDNGNRIRESRRLKDISIKYDNKLARRYSFSYQTIDVGTKTFLSSIITFGADNSSSLPSINFSYYALDKGWVSANQFNAPSGFNFGDDEDKAVRIADLNNDGLSDLYQVWQEDSSTDYDLVYLNNKNGWTLASDSDWIDPIFQGDYIIDLNGTDRGVQFADVNGDGMEDVIKCFNGNDNVYINYGTEYNHDQSWAVPNSHCFMMDGGSGTEPEGVRIADVNADGLDDLVKGKGTDIETLLNTGSGFSSSAAWDLPYAFITSGSLEEEGVRLADVNGDKLLDVLKGEGSTKLVYLNIGEGWQLDNNWTLPANSEFVDASDGDGNGVRLIDLNGDGLIDIVRCQSTASPYNYSWINTGSGWTQDGDWAVPSGACFADNTGDLHDIRLVDIDGNGLVDIMDGEGTKNTWFNKADKPYFLKQIKNQYGGVTDIQYEKSTQLDNTDAQGVSRLGFNLWVVNRSSMNNNVSGPQNVIAQNFYDYQGGKYDTDNNAFIGFRYVNETLPDNSTVSHQYFLEYPRRGMEIKTQYLDAARNLSKTIDYDITYREVDGYFITELNSIMNNNYGGELRNHSVSSKISYIYDGFGNLLQVFNDGILGMSGDERKEEYNYSYNTNSWIVSKPLNHTVYKSDLQTIQRLIKFSYDNQSYGTAPTKGDLTREEFYLDTGSSPIKTYEYNSRGNLITFTDPNGNTANFDYGIRDNTSTFVDRKRNPSQHPTNYFYNLTLGTLIKETDSNGNSIEYLYDVFGRKTKEILPYDTIQNPTKSINYTLDGIAPETILISNVRENTSQNYQENYFSYDGFGNIIQKKSETEGSLQIVTDIFYSPKFLVSKVSNPYHKNQSIGYSTPDMNISSTSYNYDLHNRISRIINPDNSNRRFSYDKLRIIQIDENNKSMEYLEDGFGNVILILENNGNKKYLTRYTYDNSDKITSIQDSSGNAINFTYDSLGQKISERDLDIGNRTYTYGKNGNMNESVDSNGNRIVYAYDSLNRLKNKSTIQSNFTYQYDTVNGTLSSVQGTNYKVNFDYDKRYRLIKINKTIDSSSYAFQFTYDSANNIKFKTFPDTVSFEHFYDIQNRLTGTDDILGSVQYDSFSAPISIGFTNDMDTNRTYFADNHRIKRIATGPFQDLIYDYDAMGNIVRITDNIDNNVISSNYDDLNRLSRSTKVKSGQTLFNQSFIYDSIGNLLWANSSNSNTTFVYGNSPIHAPIKVSSVTSNASPDGTSCTLDSQCQSGYCDNDGIGFIDDGWCFTPYNTYFDGQEIYNCEYSTGNGVSDCDERGPGDGLLFCSGIPYYMERCSNTCGYEDIISTFECTDTNCSCSTPQCDGKAAQGTINYCNKGGQAYFQDDCGTTATAEDTNSTCRSSNSLQSGDGCTADAQCNGVLAGTNGCNSQCQYTQNPPTINITQPLNNSIHFDSTIPLNWTSNEALSWCAYSLDNAANNTGICGAISSPLSGWSCRNEITLQNNFSIAMNGAPIRINVIKTLPDFNGNHFKSNGEDIRFTDSSGNNLSSFVEYWNETSQETIVWVNATIPANSNALLYMYHCNENAVGYNKHQFMVSFENFTSGNTPNGWIKNASAGSDVGFNDPVNPLTPPYSAYFISDAFGDDNNFNPILPPSSNYTVDYYFYTVSSVDNGYWQDGSNIFRWETSDGGDYPMIQGFTCLNSSGQSPTVEVNNTWVRAVINRDRTRNHTKIRFYHLEDIIGQCNGTLSTFPTAQNRAEWSFTGGNGGNGGKLRIDNFKIYKNFGWNTSDLTILASSTQLVSSQNITLTNLSNGKHNVTIFGNDSNGNMAQSNLVIFTINASSQSQSPRINLTRIYPLSSLSINQNQFFNVTTQVCCYNASCGSIDVSLDPERHEYTSTSEKRCSNGICTVSLYGDIRFIYEDNTWKKIEDARSLKNVWQVEKREDPSFPADVIDFNYTSITLLVSASEGKTERDIDLKVYDKSDKTKKPLGKDGNLKNKDSSVRIQNSGVNQSVVIDLSDTTASLLDQEIKWGDNSTFIQLFVPDSQVMDDAYIDPNIPGATYDGATNSIETTDVIDSEFPSLYDTENTQITASKLVLSMSDDANYTSVKVIIKDCLTATSVNAVAYTGSSPTTLKKTGPSQSCVNGTTLTLPLGYETDTSSTYWIGFEANKNVTLRVDNVGESRNWYYQSGSWVQDNSKAYQLNTTRTYQPQGLIKFNLSGLSIGIVQEATLRLHTSFGSDLSTMQVYQASSDWTEETVSWNNPPSDMTNMVLNSFVKSGSSAENITLDVTNADFSGSAVSFVMNHTANQGIFYDSKESGFPDRRPYLNITYTESEGEKGLISSSIGATPFYTNTSNPKSISLNQNQCQQVSWWVNATGSAGNTYEFFVIANLTSNPAISNETSHWNITIAAVDTTPPIISNLQNATTTNQSVVVTWSTDEPANQTLTIGICPSVSNVNIYRNSSLVTSHIQSISGLSNSTSYCMNVTASDASGNKANSSLSFVTAANQQQSDTTPPNISNLRNSTTTNQSAVISWDTNEAANSTLTIGLCPSFTNVNTYNNNTFSTSRNQAIANLANFTTYCTNVTVFDSSGNKAFANVSFKTPQNIRPRINVTLLAPLSSINVSQNISFNFTMQVCCLDNNCDAINASLDPIPIAEPEKVGIGKKEWAFTQIQSDNFVEATIAPLEDNKFQITVRGKQGAKIPNNYNWHISICDNEDMESIAVVDTSGLNSKARENLTANGMAPSWCADSKGLGFIVRSNLKAAELGQPIIFELPEGVDAFRLYAGSASVVIDASATSTATANGQENICVDSNGIYHVAWEASGSDLWYGNSSDGGNTWSSKEIRAGTVTNVGILCAPDDSITVYYSEGSDLDMYKSTNSGVTFTGPTTIEDTDTYNSQTCAVDSNNVAHCCLIDSGQDLWYVNTSNLNGGVEKSASDSDLCDIEVDSSNNVYIIVRDTDLGDDLDILSSKNGYSTRNEFGAGTVGSSSASYTPSIAICNNGTIYAAWIDNSDLQFCEGNVLTWSSPGSCQTLDTANSFYPDIAASSSCNPYILYTTASGVGDIVMANRTNGGSFAIRKTLVASAQHPNIGDSVQATSNRISDTLNYLYTQSSAVKYDNLAIIDTSGGSGPAPIKSGLVSTTIGAVPFYTNGTNPMNISLTANQCQNVQWWVNATGSKNTTHEFFAFVNKTTQMGISNETKHINITII